MTGRTPRRPGGQPDDEGVLALIRSVFEAVDPVPDGLVERLRFSVALAAMEGELARMTETEPALARGAPEESRTITFDSSSLTIMIRIDSNADGTARLDGWLAPPQRCRVELTAAGAAVTADADEQGRFVFASVPRGAARLVVRWPETETGPRGPGPFGTKKTVVTPAIVLLASG